MKRVLLLVLNLTAAQLLAAQSQSPSQRVTEEIAAIIDKYSRARENSDTILLKTILTEDIDQLVSSGEWRRGIQAAVQGMLVSTGNNPGARTLTIEKIRLLNSKNAIVDCRYDIQRADGTTRRMWSTFIVVSTNGAWKISAIRNMLPAGQ